MLRLVGLFLPTALGHPAYRDLFPNGFNVPFSPASGHVNRADGGGPPNAFGIDFSKAGYKWTKELCMLDSDGDGQTNGHELGDPCCQWNIGDEALRSFDLGDPSLPNVLVSSTISQNCSMANATNPEFWDFYWRTTDAQSVVDGDIEAAKPIATAVLTFTICMWIYNGLVQDVQKMGVIRFLIICFACFLWMDVLSGLLHITLDNPNLNSFPLIGGACKDFQEHHHNPGFLTRKHWLVFLQEVHVPAMAFVTWSLLRPRSGFLKVWYFLAVIGAHGMMTAHRLSHTAPSRVPAMFQLAQKTGLMISAEHHSKHHMTYDVNFSILAGVMDSVLNEVVKHCNRYSVWWLPATVIYGLFPLLVVCVIDFVKYAFFSSSSASAASASSKKKKGKKVE